MLHGNRKICYNKKTMDKTGEESKMEKSQAPIGVFDSGVGGISVLRELVKLMPEENYIYYGDSKHAPYGSKTLD